VEVLQRLRSWKCHAHETQADHKPTKPMNAELIDTAEEMSYRKDERLGILCGLENPNAMEMAIAMGDGEEWLFRFQCEYGGGEF
jgi:hypothetical protein